MAGEEGAEFAVVVKDVLHRPIGEESRNQFDVEERWRTPGLPDQVVDLFLELAMFIDMAGQVGIAVPHHDLLFVNEVRLGVNQEFIQRFQEFPVLRSLVQHVIDAVDQLNDVPMFVVDRVYADAVALIDPSQMVS